jgi:hypothetical protein
MLADPSLNEFVGSNEEGLRERHKRETDSENDGEADQSHGHLAGV